MKKLIWIIIAGVAFLVAVILLKNCSGSKAIRVTTEKAQKRTIIETVSANGKNQPEVEVKISSDVSGEIVELPVKEGEHVTKGQLLAKILPDIYQSAVDRMIASVNSSKAGLENSKSRLIQAQSQYERSKLTY